MARILVVDDSGFARRVLRQILERTGHTILEATNGESALEQYVLEQPDMVFLDQIMEDMNGLEVLRKLKQFDPNARVVLATADLQGSTEREAMCCGAYAVITKPFVPNHVLQSVQGALERT